MSISIYFLIHYINSLHITHRYKYVSSNRKYTEHGKAFFQYKNSHPSVDESDEEREFLESLMFDAKQDRDQAREEARCIQRQLKDIALPPVRQAATLLQSSDDVAGESENDDDGGSEIGASAGVTMQNQPLDATNNVLSDKQIHRVVERSAQLSGEHSA